MITLGSDRLTRNLVTEVPARYDGQEPSFALKIVENVDAIISVDLSEQPGLLADISAERLAVRAKAFESVYGRLLERGVLQVNLGNGLFPTETRAKQFGISRSALSTIFWNGVNVDYGDLQATGEQIKTTLASGRELRITAPNGTDLTMEIARRPVFVSDGVISDQDRYAGGPNCQVWLPAGEVYLTPVPGSANGKFVAETFFFQGKRIDDLTLMFDNGKLTRMTANSDIKALKERYNAAPSGRDVFAAVDIGINRNVEAPAGGRFVSWMAAGTISIGTGNNQWAGGENDVPFDLFAHLTNGTLTLDGKKVVDQGKLLVSR